jgi:AbiV family abortive infection protein
VTLSAVELCVQNAERLLLDAAKATPPTAAALAELSIEESAKAWMLFFRLLFQGRRSKAHIRLTSKEMKKAYQFLESKAEYLRGLDDEILLAFERHKVKLRFLAFLLEYIELALPVLSTKERALRIAQELHGPTFDASQIVSPPDVDGALRLLRSFRRDYLTELGEVKEHGLYVNLSETRGDLISPDVQSLPTGLLAALAGFLIVTLKGDLVLITK